MVSLTISGAREVIYQRWVTEWAATTPFLFENEKFTAPTDLPWARFTVRHEVSSDPTLGGPGDRKFDRNGRILIQLYDIVDNGLRSLDLLAAQARTVFEGVTFGGVSGFAGDVRESGDDGEWYQIVVDIPFFYSETK